MTAFRRRADYDRSYPDAAPWLYGIALNVLRGFQRSELGRNRLSDRAALDLVSAVEISQPYDRNGELTHGLAVLDGGTPADRIPPKILLLSIENIVAHWHVLHANPNARKAFRSGYTLDCALGDKVLTSRLAQIKTRVNALNAVEAEVCSTVPYCLYDGGTYFHLPLHARYFSPTDYQHLSLAGQRALAAAEWRVALKFLYD